MISSPSFTASDAEQTGSTPADQHRGSSTAKSACQQRDPHAAWAGSDRSAGFIHASMSVALVFYKYLKSAAHGGVRSLDRRITRCRMGCPAPARCVRAEAGFAAAL